MSRQGKAAICRELNKPVVVETISVDSPKRGEGMVKLAACGVCHSDLSATNGTIPLPPPLVLGHEGAGSVIEVGEGVTGFAVGEPVPPAEAMPELLQARVLALRGDWR